MRPRDQRGPGCRLRRRDSREVSPGRAPCVLGGPFGARQAARQGDQRGPGAVFAVETFGMSLRRRPRGPGCYLLGESPGVILRALAKGTRASPWDPRGCLRGARRALQADPAGLDGWKRAVVPSCGPGPGDPGTPLRGSARFRSLSRRGCCRSPTQPDLSLSRSLRPPPRRPEASGEVSAGGGGARRGLSVLPPACALLAAAASFSFSSCSARTSGSPDLGLPAP